MCRSPNVAKHLNALGTHFIVVKEKDHTEHIVVELAKDNLQKNKVYNVSFMTKYVASRILINVNDYMDLGSGSNEELTLRS